MDQQMILSVENGDSLPLMEAFYTIQGEGFYSGKPAYFLRIGGCDVGCHWCDVKESWDSNLHKPTSVKEIIQNISNFNIDTVVVTGGEPLMWNMNKLTSALKDRGLEIHLETSGTHPLSGIFDWICFSPKKVQPALNGIRKKANELKIIVNNKHDFIWAEEQRNGLNDDCKLYLQPEWSKRDQMTPLIIDYIKIHREWSISLQTHKYMKIP